MGQQNSQEQKEQAPSNIIFGEQNIINFLKSNNYQFLSLLGQKNQGTVVLAYSYQHKSNVAIKIFSNEKEFEQEKSNLLKLKGEKYIIQMIGEILNMNMRALVLELQNCTILILIYLHFQKQIHQHAINNR
ncbi:hypothetical protein ABPG74_019705 [Tetrahymena malaccensis]